MSRAKKSFRLELTKEQQAIIPRNTAKKVEESESIKDALEAQKEPEQTGK